MNIKSNNVTKKFAFAVGALVGASLLAGQKVHASTYTVKSGDTVSKIAQKKIVRNAKKVTAINFSLVIFEYCVNL